MEGNANGLNRLPVPNEQLLRGQFGLSLTRLMDVASSSTRSVAEWR